MKKKVLFIDRDGTLVKEPPVDYQLDALEKLEFYPKVMRNLGFIRSKLDFEFVMVTNQDGLGTASFPEETFWPAHNLMMKTLEGEGITFDDICIDRSMPEDNAPTRKPRTGMLTKYLNNPDYDLSGSFVIGDRPTDVELARNLGCRAILLQPDTSVLQQKDSTLQETETTIAQGTEAAMLQESGTVMPQGTGSAISQKAESVMPKAMDAAMLQGAETVMPWGIGTVMSQGTKATMPQESGAVMPQGMKAATSQETEVMTPQGAGTAMSQGTNADLQSTVASEQGAPVTKQEGVSAAEKKSLQEVCVLATDDWDKIAEFLFAGERKAEVRRTTKETDIYVALNLDGNGNCDIHTGLGFFDHMLEQIGKHGGLDLTIHVKGDLEVDEHHTIEDTAIALGDCVYQALGNKRGIERYGYCLPMDDCLCQVCLDFGGRPWLVWDADFKREKIGEMPTEMFLHFFKSFSDAAKMNLNIKAEGQNEHHKIEGIFKALARALKMAVKRDIYHFELPSSKGVL